MADMLGVVIREQDHSISFTVRCTKKDMDKEIWKELFSWWKEGKYMVTDDAKAMLGRVTIRFDVNKPLIEIYNDDYIDLSGTQKEI